MTSPGNDPRQLEHVVHRTLRELPPRPAPRTLEQRVLAEIQRRAGLPWWRMSFRHWPVAAQAGFVLVCAAIVIFALTGRGWITAGMAAPDLQQVFAPPLAWLEWAAAVIRACTSFCSIMLRNIPPVWLYGGVILLGSLYAVLFGLGAAAVKALRVQRAPARLKPFPAS